MTDDQHEQPEPGSPSGSGDPLSQGSSEAGADRTVSSGEAPTLGAGVPPRAHGVPSPAMPESIGDYRIVGLLGQGGMAVVWEAEQRHPNRRVALKVMRQGHYVDDLHARTFHREADILGRLKHPNIAAIYESGHTGDGHDFFAMELVRGQTLARWLANRPEPVTPVEIELRLRMFRTICDAVNYAHQRGVIHRDLKPSNIIVGEEHESESGATGPPVPLVKILDFGLARITDADVAATSLLTEVGMIKGTLQYMAPEQARGEIEAIDVRTDVYALGVILYELLAGRRPYDVLGTALAEAVRVICEEPPRSLSDSWSGTRKLDGDVETIVAKALEKDPERRYGSAAALADDVERYLTSQPIAARPPSRAYRLRKYAQRHRALVAAGTSTFLIFAVASVVSTAMYLRSRTEAAKAEQTAAFLGDMLTGVGPSVARGRDTTMLREILDRTAKRVGAELPGQPEVAAGIQEVLGQTYLQLGELDLAESNLNSALATFRALHSGDDPAVNGVLSDLGNVKWSRGRLAEAAALFRESLAMRRRLAGGPDKDLASALTDLGNVLVDMGRYEEAEPLLREGLAMNRTVFGKENATIAVSLNSLANLLHHRGAFAEAEPLYREALAMHRKLLGNDHPDVVVDLANLGQLEMAKGDLAASEATLRDAVATARRLYPGGHPTLAGIMTALGNVLNRRGDLAGAEAIFREALEMQRRLNGDGTAPVANALNSLAVVIGAREGQAAAEPLLREALAIQRGLKDKDSPALSNDLSNLALCLIGQDKFEEAEALFKEALAIENGRRGELDPQVLLLYNNLGRLYRGKGDLDAAEATFRKVLAGRRLALGEKHDQVGLTMTDLAEVLRDQGRFDAAEKQLTEALAVFDATLGAKHTTTLWTHAGHGRVLCDLGRCAAAEPELRASRDGLAAILGPAHPRTLAVDVSLARAVAARGDAGEADRLFKTVLDDPPRSLPMTYVTAARVYYGVFLTGRGQFPAAETQLLAAEAALRQPRGGAVRTRAEALDALVDLYEKWSATPRGAGKAAQAKKWRALRDSGAR